MSNLSVCLWFDGRAAEAAAYYVESSTRAAGPPR